VLRGIIDERRRAGDRTRQFLLLGSSSIALQQQAGESLAGRASYLELTPIRVDEWLPQGTVDALWLRGGFPDSLLAADTATSAMWREDFVRTFLERDVPMFAPGLPAPTIGRLWRMLANAQGTPLNKARLAGSLELSAPTIGRYLDFLEQMLMVRRLMQRLVRLMQRLMWRLTRALRRLVRRLMRLMQRLMPPMQRLVRLMRLVRRFVRRLVRLVRWLMRLVRRLMRLVRRLMRRLMRLVRRLMRLISAWLTSWCSCWRRCWHGKSL
jgi:hypothetical protein